MWKYLLLALLPVSAMSQEYVFQGGFESGRILDLGSSSDGFFVHTLPHPQVGSESVSSATGGFGPDSNADTRVVRSELVNGEKVTPRSGEYFLRSALYYDKDYSSLNGGKNKPRSKIYMNGHGVPFDKEGYLGFSIYLPKSWEDEKGVTGNRGEAQLLQVQSQGASWTLLRLGVMVPSGKSESHWVLNHYHSDTSVKNNGGDTQYILGPVRGDLGRWTDFALHYRFNPFSERTNARLFGGKDQVYEGNKGVLRLWKSEGPVDANGNRQMVLTKVDLMNEPVGLVPHPSELITWHFRIYKYGWHNHPTTVKGPVWVGFDEIRDGRVVDGVKLADVVPARIGPSIVLPEPPSRLTVVQ